jgi:hypothetical protein
MILLLGSAGWLSFTHYRAGQDAFLAAQSELDTATSLARQIVLLRQKPDRATMQSRSDQSLAQTIEASAVASGLAREQVARIEPHAPRRLGDSDYLEHATVVQLDNVTLSQLATTLAALRSGAAGPEQLRVSSLRISAPYQDDSPGGVEPWNAELTLTYLVYSPKTTAPRKS